MFEGTHVNRLGCQAEQGKGGRVRRIYIRRPQFIRHGDDSYRTYLQEDKRRFGYLCVRVCCIVFQPGLFSKKND